MSRSLSSSTVCVMATSTLAVATLVYYAIQVLHLPQKRIRRLRRKLPRDLRSWRVPGQDEEDDEKIWTALKSVFCEAGYTLWPHSFSSVLRSPGRTHPVSSGYGYATLAREKVESGAVNFLNRFEYMNPQQRAARTREGHDVIIRVIVLGHEGREHLNILRKLTKGEIGSWHNNHCLPMLTEFSPFDNIIFGVFPKVGGQVLEAYRSWTKNSAGDIIEMIMQMLEALEFIHAHNVAHRDAFSDNFVLQWHPESLLTMEISPSRPRVYLIDFEMAIQFPENCPSEEKVTTGIPMGGSVVDTSLYKRKMPLECVSGEPYCPFKLDVWQLGMSLSNFETTIPEIDITLSALTETHQKDRPTATEALARLKKVVYSIPPEFLLIKPSFPELFPTN